MRSSGHWLPWETVAKGGGDCSWELHYIDDDGRKALDLLSSRVASHSRHTAEEVTEALCRTMGWLCRDLSGGEGR